MKKLALILDDEIDILEALKINLEKNDFEVLAFSEVKPFYESINSQISGNQRMPNVIILDVMIPEKDGFEICRDLKNKPEFENIPIIMLSAKTEIIDKVIGLELGADDYISKPFSVRELLARIKTVTKRYEKTQLNNILKTDDKDSNKNIAKKSKDEIIKIASNFNINLNKHEVKINKELINLTSSEFKILKLLASKKEHVFSRETVLQYLWGEDKIVVDRTIDVHIMNLRKKLGKYSKAIENIRGIGYRLKLK